MMNNVGQAAPVASVEWPWGLTLLRYGVEDPAFAGDIKVPTSCGGLFVRFSEGDAALAESWISSLAAQLVMALPAHINVHYCDSGFRFRFPDLDFLARNELYHSYRTPQEIRQFGDQLSSEIAENLRFISLSRKPDLDACNREGGTPRPYTLVLLNAADAAALGLESRTFQEFLGLARQAGFTFLVYETLAPVGREARKGRDLYQEEIAARFISVRYSPDPGRMEITFPEALAEQPNPLKIAMGYGVSLAFPEVDYEACERELRASLPVMREDILAAVVGRDAIHEDTEVEFRLSHPETINAFIAGKVGTGKSTFLNNLITNIAERYTPREVELYLMDLKDGVEFNVYCQEHWHPCVRKAFLHNENIDQATTFIRELRQKHSEVMARCKAMGVKDIYRLNEIVPEGEREPHRILIIDEVERLLADASRGPARMIADDLKAILKTGRASGFHVVLATQDLANLSVDPTMLNQIQIRVAFHLDPSDCRKILSPKNLAACQLPRFRFIYNDRSGDPLGNRACISLRLETEDISKRLQAVRKTMSKEDLDPSHRPVIFMPDTQSNQAAPASNPFQGSHHAPTPRPKVPIQPCGIGKLSKELQEEIASKSASITKETEIDS